MPIAYDESRFPLLNTVWTGEPTLEDAQQFTGWMTRNFERGKPFGVVIDVSQATPPGARVLTHIADFSKANVENDRQYVCGFAYIANNLIVRATLKGYFTLASHIAPTAIHPDRVAAEAWLKERLSERGLVVS